MNADQILFALKSGRLSEQALRVISRAVLYAYLLHPESFQPLVETIQEINKPIRQQVDDAIKELDV